MNSIAQLTEKFNALESRERKMLLLGLSVVVVFLIFILIYKPMQNSIESLQKSNLANQQLLVWMKQSAAALKGSSSGSKKINKRRGRSMNVIINTTASSTGISISRSQPRDNNQYQIWLDQAVFNEVLRWLDVLQTDYGIFVSNVNLGSTDNKGLVRVNLTFQDTGS